MNVQEIDEMQSANHIFINFNTVVHLKRVLRISAFLGNTEGQREQIYDMNLIYKLVDAFLIWQLGQRYVIFSNFMSYERNY